MANKKYFKLDELKLLVDKYFDKKIYKISFEPGRYLIAKSGTLITKIILIKSGIKNFIVVDAGMNTFIRPALYNAFHNILPMLKNDNNTNR